MTGEKWNEFLDSIKTRGVIEPIVITPEKIIISGHQRVRACKELGIRSVMYIPITMMMRVFLSTQYYTMHHELKIYHPKFNVFVFLHQLMNYLQKEKRK